MRTPINIPFTCSSRLAEAALEAVSTCCVGDAVSVVFGTMGYVHMKEKYHQVHIEEEDNGDDDEDEQRNFEMPAA